MSETVNVAAAPNPFKIGMTFKAATGFDAEWLTPTVYGASADETAQRAVDLIKALADRGVVEMVSHAAVAVRTAHKGDGGGSASRGGAAAPKTFQGGKVQPKTAPAGDDSCQHGRTLREGNGKNGPWAALFCSAREKSEQCDPLWKDQKTGEFR
ncbi:hypothetical protein ACIBAH_35085 [Streptomyces sp. NPDC051445]|uniref:hypothetical protein n=1 Tax=Streptomyces sp. NPDC051445 TaxID=3365653 RepID=UPI0037A3AC6C